LRLAAALPLLLAALDPAAVLSSVRRAYTASPSFTARFVQSYVPAGFAPASPETGSVTMAAPDRIRFDYDGKEGKLFTFDGTAARQYVAADRQLVVRTLTPDEKERLPLIFFESPEALLRRFTASAVAVESGLTEVTLTPRSGGEPAKLELAVAASGEVRRLVITDLAGNRTTFAFTGLVASGRRPAADFAPAPPPGTKVISDGKESR
jgi:outer membrane lipoprotein-sorting protein